MSIAEILDTMDYGPAPESDKDARAWISTTRPRPATSSTAAGGSRRAGTWFETANPATGEVLAKVAQAGAADVDAAVQGRAQGAAGMGGALRLRAGEVPLRARAADPAAQPPVRGGRGARQRQADPRDARHRRAAGRAALLSSRRLGAAHGDRARRPRAGRRLRADHPVELPAADARLEDRAGDCARQHRRPEAGRVHAADGAALRRDLRDGGPAEGRGQHRHRRWRDRRADRQAPRHRQDRLHRLDRSRPQDPRGDGRHRQVADAGARRQVAVHRLRRRRSRFGGRGRGRRDLVQPGPGLLRRLAPARPGRHRRRVRRRSCRRGMETLRVGSPLDKAIDIGAIVAPVQLERIRAAGEAGRGGGRDALSRATRELPASGCFYPPTLLTNVAASLDRARRSRSSGRSRWR